MSESYNLFKEIGLTADELEIQSQLERDHALAQELQRQYGGAVAPVPENFGVIDHNPEVFHPPDPPIEPVVRREPVARPQTKKKKKKKANETAGWKQAVVAVSEDEFKGWTFKDAPPALK